MLKLIEKLPSSSAMSSPTMEIPLPVPDLNNITFELGITRSPLLTVPFISPRSSSLSEQELRIGKDNKINTIENKNIDNNDWLLIKIS